jgi:hypothetical protein
MLVSNATVAEPFLERPRIVPIGVTAAVAWPFDSAAFDIDSVGCRSLLVSGGLVSATEAVLKSFSTQAVAFRRFVFTPARSSLLGDTKPVARGRFLVVAVMLSTPFF